MRLCGADALIVSDDRSTAELFPETPDTDTDAVEEEDDFTGWADVDFVVWAAAPETPTARARSEMLTAAITFLIEDLLGRRPRLQCACHARRRWREMCKWLPAHAVAARKPGIGGRARRAGTPHRLRDMFACDMLARGASIFDVAKMLADTHFLLFQLPPNLLDILVSPKPNRNASHFLKLWCLD